MSDRETLAERQAALVRHLVADGPVPDGFDARRLTAAREQLRCKDERTEAKRRARRARGGVRAIWMRVRSLLRR